MTSSHLNSIDDHHRAKRELHTTQDELKPDEENENYKTDFKLTLKSGDPASMEVGKVIIITILSTVSYIIFHSGLLPMFE